MNQILEQALLYDFYGELLTEHQKDIYEQFIQEDLSLGEIAQRASISRQGVHDMIRRCDRSLRGYEQKLHLVERFMAVKKKVDEINQLLDQSRPEETELAGQIRKIADEILDEL